MRTLADLGEAERSFYRENGYLAVAEGFDSQQVQDAKEGISDLVAGVYPEFKGAHYEAASAGHLDSFDHGERLDAMRKLNGFVAHEERLKRMAFDPALIRVVRFLLGDQEPHLYADQAMSKPPKIGREKPWHQDLAFFDFDPFSVPVVGVWIALDDVGTDNGCMQLLAGRHKGGPMVHFQRRDWQICDTEMRGKSSVAVPLPPGGLLFFDGLLPHGTPHNSSARRRRALQFHYVPEGSVQNKVDRLKYFGSEGKDVEC